MRNLFFTSLTILILAAGCTSIRPAGLEKCAEMSESSPPDRSPFKGRFEKMLFKASFDIRSDHLTGLMLIKKMADSSIQIVFANEIGMTYFNFNMKKDSFEPVFCFGPLNKKALFGILRACFELMLDYELNEKGRVAMCNPTDGGVSLGGKAGRYFVWSGISGREPKTAFVNGMTNFSNKTLITFSDFSAGIPKSVLILNPFIDLRIRLEMISF
jgi:hypothetical protein